MSCRLPSLTVAFSTRGARALALDPVNWPCEAGLDYLMLVQEADVDSRVGPHLETIRLGRQDMTVQRLDSTGLSRSRNAALDLARGDLVLIADDDVAHPPGAFEAIRRAFAADPRLDLLAGRSLLPNGEPRKRGQQRPHRLRLWNSARISSHELAFRRSSVLAAGVRFDEGFGVGAGTPAILGEEYIFVADCLKAGLRGVYQPFPVSIHPPHSSGLLWAGTAPARARAAVMERVFGPWAPLARLAFAAKNLRRFQSVADLSAFLRGR